MSTDTDTSTEPDDTPDAGDDPDDGFTTSEDYRHPYLSTVWAVGYGFGFFAFTVAITLLPTVKMPNGFLMSVLTLAWIGTVAYIIGPESIRTARELKGGGKA